ncbi:DDE-type integrase/transposase/recombinase [Arthrobacter sp. UYCu712]|uniref:DDE-type integrase/transposase/recombinase n=1 Tax=Arthrobacter sp. UYCu712 TaxID=3156340 RepID=UPI003390A99B
MQVAARTYRAWKKRLPALRTIEDARITDALRGLKVPDVKGRPRPEIIYGRRKITQWLRRSGFPEASKHTVDRLMREEGMNGLVRGRKTRTTIPGKDGRRAGDLLNRDFTSPAPNQIWVTDFTYVPVYSGFVYVALVIDLYSRAIVGWETSTVKDTAFVEHCLRMRCTTDVRHSLEGLCPCLPVPPIPMSSGPMPLAWSFPPAVRPLR